MNSSLGRLKLYPSTLETLFKNKDCLDDQSFDTNIHWMHLLETQTTHFVFTVDELNEQFDVLERVLESKYTEERSANKRFFSNERDEFKIAIEQYKLAIMEAALQILKNNEEENPAPKSPSRTIDINQKQIELTHEYIKQLALHSEHEKISEAESYEKHMRLARKFDGSIKKTKERVENIPKTFSPKAAKITLLFCGMAFTAADEIFLAVGFGALALSGPLGWVIIAATAVIGAILFYVAFNHMIRDKEDIHRQYAKYQKDDLLQSMEDRLAAKKHLERLETELLQKKLENYQLILDQKRKDDELREMKDRLDLAEDAVRKKPMDLPVVHQKTHIKKEPATPKSKPAAPPLLSFLNFSKLRAIPPPIKQSPEGPTAIVLSDYFGHKD